MSDPKVDKAELEKEAQARLKSFEVGISHICNDPAVNLPYAEFAKRANEQFKFADKPEDAEGKLAPWLVDVIVTQAAKAEA